MPAWQHNAASAAEWQGERDWAGRAPAATKPWVEANVRGRRGAQDKRVPAAAGQRHTGIGRRAGNLAQTGYQWAVKQKKRLLSTRRGRITAAIVAACLLLGTLGPAGLAYMAYSHIKSTSTAALAHLKGAETSLKQLETDPFNTTAIQQAHDQLAAANASFLQLNKEVQGIPGFLSATPLVGSKLDAAMKVAPIAVEATQAGMVGMEMLGILAPKMKSPLDPSIPGLTSADMATIQAKFNTVYSLMTTILAQVQALPPSAASLDARLGALLTAVQSHLPEIQQGLEDAKNVVALLPQLLGLGKPANYLLQILDSTELRPGGGFMGNYGALTVSGGRMQGKPQIKDVDLCDQHDVNKAKPILTDYPQYKWFTAASAGGIPYLGFQDANLEGDFPTDAQLAQYFYNYAHCSTFLKGNITSFQGVIAITPQLIASLMQNVTGPITLPEYHNIQVDQNNLIQEIHLQQLTNQGQGGFDNQVDPNPICGGSSYRKCFTAYLFSVFMAQLGKKSAQGLGAVGKVVVTAIHSKDLQIFFNAPQGEALLQHHDLASALQVPKTGDGMMVVDANEGGNKSNNYVNYTWNDQVSIDTSGTATHHLVLTYLWPDTPTIRANAFLAPSEGYNYQDYVRIYLPPSSTVTAEPTTLTSLGDMPSETTGFGMKVVEGLIFVPIGQKFTLTLSWTVPHAAIQMASGWLYQFAVEKQAGIERPLAVQVNLPSCAHVFGALQGFTTPSAHTAVVNEPLDNDVTLSMQYTC